MGAGIFHFQLMAIPFDNSYVNLPDAFFQSVEPSPVSAPKLIAFNDELAVEIGLEADFITSEDGLSVLAGNLIPEGAEPLAMAYSGHQFGGFSPVLGDGRAILLGEVVGRDGTRRDIQLKGSGPTPFSRRGDGRSALGPVLREYLVSEAMHALGIPTTRALAAVESGDQVTREKMEPGGVFTRVAKSHLRIGTAQYFAARSDYENLKILVDYTLRRHYPESANSENPALDLLQGVMRSQAELIAKWMGVGFIHGVMNTDNMSLSGETIDYGPCAFMDHYDPARKFSFIDRGGRYAFANQPSIAHWNLTRLAEALLPLIAKDEKQAIEIAETELETFPSIFEPVYIETFCQKLGINSNYEKAFPMVQSLLDIMAEDKIDFTLAFRHLSGELDPEEPGTSFRDLFANPTAISQWIQTWKLQLDECEISFEQAKNRMTRTNPVYIPRNHRIEEVIEAGKRGNYQPFHDLHQVLKNPFSASAQSSRYERPPDPGEIVAATFCGT